MRALVYASFLLSPLLVILSHISCRTTRPRPAAWALVTSALILAAATAGALALLAWPVAARDPLIARVGQWQPSALGQAEPVPLPVSVLAAGALMGVWVLTLAWFRRQHADRRRLALVHRELGVGAAPVIVVDEPAAMALAVPGSRHHGARIVLSRALVDELDGDERAAVVAHERAHLRHHHRRFVAAIDLAVSLNPLLRPMRTHLAHVLERWADDDAARTTSTTATARAVAKAALAGIASLPARVATGAVLHVARLGVPARVHALLHDEPSRRGRWSLVLIALVAVAALASVAYGSHDTEKLFEALQRHAAPGIGR